MKNHVASRWVLAVATCVLGSPLACGEAPTFEEISVIQTEFEPWGGIVNRGDGYFYGAARWAATAHGGVVYRVAPRQSAQVLHKFPEVADASQPNIGGSNPSCGLVLGSDGAFYGATDAAGAYGSGTIYRISADGVFSVVHDIRASEGYDVHSLVATPAGEIYGSTEGGKFDGGTLFRIGPDGVYQTVYAFHKKVMLPPGDPVEPGFAYEAYEPWHLALGTDGKIYGTTQSGGPVNKSGFFQFTYGTFFRYDGPGAVTVLCNFDSLQKHAQSNAAASDGFYVTTEKHLVHIAFDGTLVVSAAFESPTDLFLGKVLVTADGVYGDSFTGGANESGFIYRFNPGGSAEILHDFSSEYRNRLRCLAAGNDGLVYGLAAFPRNFVAAAGSPAGAANAMAAVTSNGPRTFRFRQGDAANFIPLAKPDAVSLASNAPKGRRKVLVDVLANDRDPDSDPLTITSVTSLGAGSARIVATDVGPRLRFDTAELDPASQLVTYQLSDGKGGGATGYVAVRSPAPGSYKGMATNLSKPAAASATLKVEISDSNIITATFVLAGRSYVGKGILDVDDTADLALVSKGRTSKNLHLGLKRGAVRKLSARIDSGAVVYGVTCKQKAVE